jgi:alginate O-acetyltransferase complex protein AlgI
LKLKNFSLIAFSVIFYSWGEPVWVFLLLLTTLIDYQMAKLIEKYIDHSKSRVYLYISIALSLGALIFFKYGIFIVENINFITGMKIKYPSLDMPIGISFYTFQSISYMVDVYNGKVKAEKSYSKYLLFISLFHQLIAGPIVRYTDIAKEITARSVNWTDISYGVDRFIRGLFKKVFFANTAAILVERCLERDLSTLTFIEGVLGLTMFAIQLYYDFSGYSDMAIGMGRMIGFTYCENFNYPYASKSIKEFWSRWHISLGTFLRDYVFNPIAFKRKKWGIFALIYSLMITFFVSGLWHGASWNFVFWGLYFAILIILEDWFLNKLLLKLGTWAQHAYLIVAVVFSYTFFYFVDFSKMIGFLKVLFNGNTVFYNPEIMTELYNHGIWLLFAVFFLFPWGSQIVKYLTKLFGFNTSFVFTVKTCVNLSLLCIAISLLVAKSYNPFLYFRF